MTPTAFYQSVISPRAALLGEHDSPEARCLLMAIAGQESGWTDREQEPVGYAHGFWQCEQGGAVTAVFDDHRTKPTVLDFCAKLSINPEPGAIFRAILGNDTMAYVVARLALLLDPAPLPAIADQQGAWIYYVRVWRPGTPRPETWPDRHAAAQAVFRPATSSGAIDSLMAAPAAPVIPPQAKT